MILLEANHGVRRHEVATIHSYDVVSDTSDGISLLIQGKGGKQRLIWIDASEIALLQAIRQCDGWLFPGSKDGHLAPQRVGDLVSGQLGPGYTGHQLRHSFGSGAYAATRDLLGVMRAMGHTRPETTLRYIELDTDTVRAITRARLGLDAT